MNQWKSSLVSALIALFFLVEPNAIALNPSVQPGRYAMMTWRKQDGLPASRVLDVLQTRDGYLWAGTSNGLARFDGKRFVNYDVRKLTGQASNAIRNLLEDRKGRLWIGTSDGLALLRDNTLRGIKAFAGIGITGLVEDWEGAIWMTTSEGLYRWCEGELHLYSVADGLPSKIVASGAMASDGSVWFGTDHGVVRYQSGTFRTYGAANGLAGDLVTSVHADRLGMIWVGTTQGLSKWDGTSFFTYTAKDTPASISVFALLQDRDSNLWFGGTNSFGPVRLQAGHFTAFPAGSIASDLIVYSYFEDREGCLWIATSDGLLQLRDLPFTTLTTADGLPANNIRLVQSTGDGAIWASSNRSGLMRLKGARVESFGTEDGLSSRGISVILQRGSGAMIVATTYHGLNLSQGRRWIPFLRGVLPTERITALLEDRNGDLWVGTEDGGVVYLPRAGPQTFSERQGLGSNFISKLLEAPDGTIWIGTEHGLTIWDHGKLHSPGFGKEFTTANVSGLLSGHDGAIWIATSDGLSRFLDGRMVHFGSKQGVPEGPVAQPVEDNQGRLWFFSSAGLARWNPPALGTDTRGPDSIDLYTSADGLASDSHGGPPQHIVKSPDGKIWIATARGLSFVDPGQLRKNQVRPPVQIEELLADGKVVERNRAIELAPDSRRLEIRYTGLSLSIPERVHFRYRLIGFDKVWKEAGTDRSATYTNLSAGTYKFHVIACNNDGVWNTTGAWLQFSRRPYFYQTLWFRICAGLLACLAGWSFYQQRLKQMKREFGLVLEERTRIARELHDTLLQGFTAVTLQVQVASDSVQMSASNRQTLQTVLQQADEQLREARRAVWDLRPSTLESRDIVAALQKLVEQGPGLQPKRHLTVEGTPTPLNSRVESAILRVAEEALTNARRHSGAESVWMSLSFQRSAIVLTIVDNGKGFDSPGVSGAVAGHFGLRGMQERVEGAGGRFSLNSKPGDGTKIRADFPQELTRV